MTLMLDAEQEAATLTLAQIGKYLIRRLGEDVDREGLLETPDRFAKAWREWTKGYAVNPSQLLKTFTDGANGVDEMISVQHIRVYSHCEHHLAPIIGEATVAYIPNGKIVGLSKMSRIVDAFARRLQVQERLTRQVASCLEDGLHPKGVGVMIKARHLCMESRGCCEPGAITTTTALTGLIKTNAATRAEFLALGR